MRQGINVSGSLSRMLMADHSRRKIIAGINGFGRLGLHLFRYWLLNRDSASFSIGFINDPQRSARDIAKSIKRDDVIGSIPNSVKCSGSKIVIDGAVTVVATSEEDIADIPWHADTELIFEASGKFTEEHLARRHLRGRVKKVIITATSPTAHKTVILGVNHDEYEPKSHHVVSYGSCTVNAFVPIADVLHKAFTIKEAHVHVTHNTPLREIEQQRKQTGRTLGEIATKNCTLRHSAPQLLPFLNDDFSVTYNMIPDAGVSLMDMSFRFKEKVSAQDVLGCLEKASKESHNVHLAIEKDNQRSYHFVGHPASAIIRASHIHQTGSWTHVSAWFDNENSATRVFDFANFLVNMGEIN